MNEQKINDISIKEIKEFLKEKYDKEISVDTLNYSLVGVQRVHQFISNNYKISVTINENDETGSIEVIDFNVIDNKTEEE